MLDWGEKNFADCDLGDERLNNRAYCIGQTLSQEIGKGLSESFHNASDLKRSYEFLAMRK